MITILELIRRGGGWPGGVRPRVFSWETPELYVRDPAAVERIADIKPITILDIAKYHQSRKGRRADAHLRKVLRTRSPIFKGMRWTNDKARRFSGPEGDAVVRSMKPRGTHLPINADVEKFFAKMEPRVVRTVMYGKGKPNEKIVGLMTRFNRSTKNTKVYKT